HREIAATARCRPVTGPRRRRRAQLATTRPADGSGDPRRGGGRRQFARQGALALFWGIRISVRNRHALPPLAGEGAEGGWGRAEGAKSGPHPALRATFSRKREKGLCMSTNASRC